MPSIPLKEHQPAMQPRMINFINFLRAVEPRDPSIDLVEPVIRQLDLARRYNFPVTWLLQYDALIDPRYVDLLKSHAPESHEIGGWFEIVEPQAKAAGIPWRGRYPWDWHCNTGFSIAYTPAQRERLVDIYMKKFRDTFGRYPATIGCWLLDAHTLAYMSDKYGLTASCICKDQRGTDGYTLWGGYFNQAYYPSRSNAYMPAQTGNQQIPVPVFRMLGSDPIYQYDAGDPGEPQPVITLESIYDIGGGDPDWVRWFYDVTFKAPCLSFGYAQLGQENSFGWPGMRKGLTDQCAQLAERVARGEARVETLETSGRWFRSQYVSTPASAVTALDDWKHEDRQSVWYCSRFYRVNFLRDAGTLRLRDVHVFDERYAEPFITDVCTSTACMYDTLPVVDEGTWSRSSDVTGFVSLDKDGGITPLRGGALLVEEHSADILRIEWPLNDGGKVEIVCNPASIRISSSRTDWALALPCPPPGDTELTDASGDELHYRHKSFPYCVDVKEAAVSLGAKTLLLRPSATTIECCFH